jgi:hypothetical protein
VPSRHGAIGENDVVVDAASDARLALMERELATRIATELDVELWTLLAGLNRCVRRLQCIVGFDACALVAQLLPLELCERVRGHFLGQGR